MWFLWCKCYKIANKSLSLSDSMLKYDIIGTLHLLVGVATDIRRCAWCEQRFSIYVVCLCCSSDGTWIIPMAVHYILCSLQTDDFKKLLKVVRSNISIKFVCVCVCVKVSLAPVSSLWQLMRQCLHQLVIISCWFSTLSLSTYHVLLKRMALVSARQMMLSRYCTSFT